MLHKEYSLKKLTVIAIFISVINWVMSFPPEMLGIYKWLKALN